MIDFQDVSFHSLSADKVVCAGAKPAAEPVPDSLLALASKVITCRFINHYINNLFFLELLHVVYSFLPTGCWMERMGRDIIWGI